jgi:rod shape-determining protein MreC
MPVIVAEGIVGRVFRVQENTADVLTVLDLLSGVDSVVKRSRARGVVEGLSDELCQLKFALRTDDIRPGDLLLSSGFGGIFPKGVRVGEVVRAEKEAFGITQTVEVRPTVHFSKLEEVLVITKMESAPVHTELPDGEM